jgi:hypothetical protein
MRTDQAEDKKLRTPADARDGYQASQRAALCPSDATACSLSSEDREWKPISTAPKSARAVIVYCPERMNTYAAENGSGSWRVFGSGSILAEIPSHWMPLPPSPENDTALAPPPQRLASKKDVPGG